jgi:hypothetical protein
MNNYHPVAIDMDFLCRRLSEDAGRPVSDVEAHVWLRNEGFVLFGNQWIGDDQSAQKLANLHRQLSEQPPQ